MRNPKLDAAIEAAASVEEEPGRGERGPTGVAYRLGMTVSNLYKLRAAGRVWDVQHALKLQELALEGGYEVTIRELAGLSNGGGKLPRPTTTGRGRGRAGARSGPSSSPAHGGVVAPHGQLAIVLSTAEQRRRAANE